MDLLVPRRRTIDLLVLACQQVVDDEVWHGGCAPPSYLLKKDEATVTVGDVPTRRGGRTSTAKRITSMGASVVNEQGMNRPEVWSAEPYLSSIACCKFHQHPAIHNVLSRLVAPLCAKPCHNSRDTLVVFHADLIGMSCRSPNYPL